MPSKSDPMNCSRSKLAAALGVDAKEAWCQFVEVRDTLLYAWGKLGNNFAAWRPVHASINRLFGVEPCGRTTLQRYEATRRQRNVTALPGPRLRATCFFLPQHRPSRNSKEKDVALPLWLRSSDARRRIAVLRGRAANAC